MLFSNSVWNTIKIETFNASMIKFANLLCNLRVGLSPWSCLRGKYGEGWGRGNEEMSWVWSLYQWGSSSSSAVSSSIRIYRPKTQRPRLPMIRLLFSSLITFTTLLQWGCLNKTGTFNSAKLSACFDSTKWEILFLPNFVVIFYFKWRHLLYIPIYWSSH